MRIATLILSRDTHTRIAASLARDGIEAAHFESVERLIAALQTQPFAAALVEDDERHVQQWLGALQQHAGSQTALIVVGQGGASDMSRALLHGADDYVISGTEDDHLVSRSMARVSVKLRRSAQGSLRIGPYRLDGAGELISSVARVRLTPRERALALALFQNRGRLVSLERLCVELCGDVSQRAERAVKQHAYALRKKCLEVTDPGAAPLRIETVYGKGYRLAA